MINYIRRYANRIRRNNLRNSLTCATDRELLLRLKGTFKGQRIFVIGNGPSLDADTLKKLMCTNLPSIASNKIYLIFSETSWRPDVYTVADWCVAENNKERIRKLDLLKVFPNELKQYFGGNEAENGRSIFYEQFVPAPVDDDVYESYFMDDFLDKSFVGETITNLNIQLASFMGAAEIVLLGVDGRYKFSKQRIAHQHYQEVFVAGDEVNHFHPDYRKKGETWSVPRPEAHERNYQKCVETLKAKGVRLLNASPNTEVEAIPKVSLRSVL